MGRALGTQTGAGTVGVQRQYHTDEQGNVLAISDDSQATAVSYDIGAFGNVRSGSATDQPLDFVGGQGYQRDADAGTLYVRARHYDPATGEWLSQDPIEGEPAYAYGYNSPTAFTDASGTGPRGAEAVTDAQMQRYIWDHLIYDALKGPGVGEGIPMADLKAVLRLPASQRAAYFSTPCKSKYSAVGRQAILAVA